MSFKSNMKALFEAKEGRVWRVMNLLFPGDLVTITSPEGVEKNVDPVYYSEQSSNSYSSRGLGIAVFGSNEEKNAIDISMTKFGSFYIPKANDMVIGFVKKEMNDGYSVEIGMPVPGFLSSTAYEGATKQTPLILEPGEIVYCRVLPRSVNPKIFGGSAQVQLSCMDQYGSSAKLGKLVGGYVVNTSISNAISLMNVSHPLLQELSKSITFEFCSGANGKLWFNSTETSNMVVMWNVFKDYSLSIARAKQILEKFKKN